MLAATRLAGFDSTARAGSTAAPTAVAVRTTATKVASTLCPSPLNFIFSLPGVFDAPHPRGVGPCSTSGVPNAKKGGKAGFSGVLSGAMRCFRLPRGGNICQHSVMERTTQLVGQSSSFLDAVERASRAAPLDRPVLVIGERGTGKELIAERLHHLSSRWDGPLVTMNCAALPETLIEAELFGH